MSVSIKNKIYLSFFLLVFLFIVNGIASIITLNNTRQLSEHISQITDPSLEAIENFEDILVESKMYTTNWVFFRSSKEDKDALRKLHDADYPKLKQRLNLLSSKWDDKASEDSLNKIYVGFERLLVFEKKIMTSLQKSEDYDDPVIKRDAERIVEDELFPRTSTLMNALVKIKATGENIKIQKNKDLKSSSMLLRALISVLAVTIICTGIFLSLYLTKIIIDPINKIRHIVSDLGRGIINKVEHNSGRDEIGDMVLSVNNLSEKLQGTASFAQEVGNRNFDIPFHPLSDEDTLGKALIAMRDNLKTSERELLDANAEIQTIYNASLDAVIIIDEGGKIVKWDHKSEILFGWKEDEVMGRVLAEFIIPLRYRESHHRGMKHFLRTGEGPVLGKTIEVCAIKKNNAEFDISLSISPSLIKGTYQFIGFIRDITSRKKAEESLSKSEANLRNILENTDTAYLLLDKEANILSYNHVAKELALKQLSETLAEGKNYISIFPKARQAEVRKTVKNVLERKKQISYEVCNQKDKNAPVWLYISMQPILNDNKKMIGLSVAATNITARKNAEEKIKTSEAHLQASQRIAHIGSWELELKSLDPLVLKKNPNVNTLRWSDETYRMFGIEPGTIEPNNEFFFDKIYPEDQILIDNAIQNAIMNGTGYDLEHRIKLGNENERIVQEWANIVFDPQTGIPLKLIGTIQDITERKLAEQRVKQSNERYELVSKATNDAIWDWNLLTNEVYWGHGYEVLFGYSESNSLAPTNNWRKHIHPDDRDRVYDGIHKAINHPGTDYWEGDYRFLRSNDEIAYVYDRGHIIYDSNSKPIRMVGAMSDITAIKLAEIERDKITADLIQRNNVLEQFSYIVSHNLRAPVANIIGFTNALSDPALNLQLKNQFISGLAVSSRKLESVILDLNHILQIRRDLNENKITVYLPDLLSDILISIDSMIKKEKAEIKFDFTEAEKIVTIKSYLHSIFLNLITNSIKYRQLDTPPLIEVTSHRCKDKIRILFSDNGMGIDLSTRREQVFGLYKRFHTHIEGKGIGLFITKTQVEALGGKITINSEVNKGTTFKIEFDI